MRDTTIFHNNDRCRIIKCCWAPTITTAQQINPQGKASSTQNRQIV